MLPSPHQPMFADGKNGAEHRAAATKPRIFVKTQISWQNAAEMKRGEAFWNGEAF
jgi:hypothetical protein